MTKLTKRNLIKRANKFFEKEEYEECVETSNMILKTFPKELNIYLIKMNSLLHLTKEYTIRETAFQYLNNSPKEESNYIMAFKYLDESHNHDLSVTVMEDALKLYPESYQLIFLNLRRLYIYENDAEEEIIKFIDSFSKTIPFWTDLMQFKAKIYKNSENYNKSLEIYDEILESSCDLETLSRKLKILKILEMDEKAIEILDKMIAKNNEKTWALANKGLYYAGKNNQKAMDFIDEAIENDSKYGFSYFAKASVLFDMKNYDKVEKYIEKALSLDENLEKYPELLFLSAKVNLQAKDLDSALNIAKIVDFRADIFEEVMVFGNEINSLKLQDLIDKAKEMEKKDPSLKSVDPNGLSFSEQLEEHIKSGAMKLGASDEMEKFKNKKI